MGTKITAQDLSLAEISSTKERYKNQFRQVFDSELDIYWDDEVGFDSDSFSAEFLGNEQNVKSSLCFLDSVKNAYGEEAYVLMLRLTKV